MLTLTHCRFEAKAVHGIQQVIVADFDEFLYCPAGGPTAEGQKNSIQKMLVLHQSRGAEQIWIHQRVLANKTSSTRNCMIKKLSNNSEKKQSMFNCFAPYEWSSGGHSDKSIHLGHLCPLTGYHGACSASNMPRAYDCLCYSTAIKANPWRPYINYPDHDCSFVHFSTNRASFLVQYTPTQVSEFRNRPNEISLVLQSSSKF